MKTKGNKNSSKIKSKNKLPKIAFIGAESLGPSHGTGMMMARHFSKYPKDLLVDIHFQQLSNSRSAFKELSLKQHDINYCEFQSEKIIGLNDRLKGKKKNGGSLLYRTKIFDDFNPDWKSMGGAPDLIFSTCFSAQDFSFLHHIYRNLPKKVPIVQHFLDLDFKEFDTTKAIFNEMLPAMANVSALTIPIWYAVNNFSGVKAEMTQALHQKIEKDYKKVHLEYSSKFSAVIIGNIWSATAFRAICRLWRECQKEIPGLKPIKWYGHSRRFAELKALDKELEVSKFKDVIVDGGFLTNSELTTKLRAADIAIVAFSGETIDKEHYTYYSLPSRIGDYCANGLPILFFGSSDSEPFRIISDKKLGLAIDPIDFVSSKKRAIDFIRNVSLRIASGNNSRKFAEDHLDLEKYQNLLYSKMVEYSKFKIPKKFLNSFK